MAAADQHYNAAEKLLRSAASERNQDMATRMVAEAQAHAMLAQVNAIYAQINAIKETARVA